MRTCIWSGPASNCHLLKFSTFHLRPARLKPVENADDSLKGRVVELSLGDLNKEEDQSFRKIKLRVEDVKVGLQCVPVVTFSSTLAHKPQYTSNRIITKPKQGRNCLTSFHGMDFTTDKLRSLVRKWQSLIEAHIDVRTTDGYLVRLFAIAFTRKNRQQVKKTSYAQAAQIRQIRQKMMEIMKRESECELKELVQKFVPESIGREIEKATKVCSVEHGSQKDVTVLSRSIVLT